MLVKMVYNFSLTLKLTQIILKGYTFFSLCLLSVVNKLFIILNNNIWFFCNNLMIIHFEFLFWLEKIMVGCIYLILHG